VRDNLFSFDVGTGAPTAWTPNVNGEVNAAYYMAPYLYVGGSFTTADGVNSRLVRYRVDSGTPAIDTAWPASTVSAPVNDIDSAGGRLIVAGAFRQKLMALNPVTGRDSGYINLGIAGSVKRNGAGPVEVYRFAVSPEGTATTVLAPAQYRGKASERSIPPLARRWAGIPARLAVSEPRSSTPRLPVCGSAPMADVSPA
jgi:hypothetical protein